MAYSMERKKRAIQLRSEGKSLSLISRELGVSKSTASLWVSSVELDTNAITNIANLRIIGQQKANLVKEQRKRKTQDNLNIVVRESLSRITITNEYIKVLCSLLFWAEGSKSGSFVSFINSDPKMIELFLFTLRNSFIIDEKKLRGLIHIHEYHDDDKVKKYWSNVSRIPLSQFNKSYQKPNTGKQKKEGYLGSFRIRYYDVEVARELTAIYTMLPEVLKIGL